MNEEDDLTQEDVDEYNKRRQKEYDDANNPQDPNDLEEELKKRKDRTDTFEAQTAEPDRSIDKQTEEDFSKAQTGIKTIAEGLYNIGKGTLFLKTGGSIQATQAFDALRAKIEGKKGPIPSPNPNNLGGLITLEPLTTGGALKDQKDLPPVTSGPTKSLLDIYGGSISPEQKLTLAAMTGMIKGSSDPTGAGSERFLFGEDVFGNLPEANKKALAKLGITNNESKLLINRYNKIGRDSAGAVESVFTTYYDFEKTKSDVFPFFAKEMKNVTQTQTPQLDHVAQLVASLGFFDGQPVKYWPEIAKIVVNEGVFGLGHDPKNLKYLAFDVHTVKSNFWRDNIGDAGEKFFKGRDLSTLPKLKAAAKEYAAIIRRSNKLVETANAQYKLLNKTDISQAELEEFISRLGDNPLESKYNIKQVKAILKQMEDDGFLVDPKTTQAEETQVVKSEQRTAKDRKARQAKIDQEFQKSVVESETYRKYYASDPGKFKSPLVKGSKDDMLITHAEDIYEEMSVDKNPETRNAMIKKIMKIIKPRYKG